MIRLVAMDVDGTLTDGGLYIGEDGSERKRFHVHDGYGIKLLRSSGIEVAFLSGRRSAATDRRAEELGVSTVVNGAGEKLPILMEMARRMSLLPEEVSFIGDDLPDVACIRWAGLGIAVANARKEVLAAADWVTPSRGGWGAVRDASEYILERNGAGGDRP